MHYVVPVLAYTCLVAVGCAAPVPLPRDTTGTLSFKGAVTANLDSASSITVTKPNGLSIAGSAVLTSGNLTIKSGNPWRLNNTVTGLEFEGIGGTWSVPSDQQLKILNRVATGSSDNNPSGDFSACIGGAGNTGGYYGVICGGQDNVQEDVSSFIAGGQNNIATEGPTAIIGSIGSETIAECSAIAGGFGLVTMNANMTAVGRYNDVPTTYTRAHVEFTPKSHLFVVGNGTADGSRSNAFLVWTDGDTSVTQDLTVGRYAFIGTAAYENTKRVVTPDKVTAGTYVDVTGNDAAGTVAVDVDLTEISGYDGGTANGQVLVHTGGGTFVWQDRAEFVTQSLNTDFPGFDSDMTQTFKNVTGTIQWVTDP